MDVWRSLSKDCRSFSISNSAAKKIKDSGGEIIKFSEMIEKFPTGKGVKIIG